MAITAKPYGQFLQDLLAGVHNVAADTIKVALLTSAYTPALTTHTSYADVVAAQVSGSGYTAGGATLASVTVSYFSGVNTVTVTADAITWDNLTATCRYAVIYRVGSSNAASKLIGLIDFGADRTYGAEPLELSFPSGVVTIGAF